VHAERSVLQRRKRGRSAMIGPPCSREGTAFIAT
jgi:hypothetical protein